MASPSVVGTPAETAISTAGTSHVVNLPAGATGNLLVAIMNKGSTAATVNALTGWTELLDENSANGLYIAYRVCDGTEGSTTTFTLSASTRGAWIVYEISGQIDPATQAPQIGTTATGSSVSPDPPSVSVTGGAKDVLTIACFGRDGEEADDDTWVTAAPSGFGTLLQKACGVAGTNLGGMIATAHLASNTATSNPGVFTCATGAWRAQTIVIHPVIPPTPKAGTDSGSGSDTSALAARVPPTDSGTGADVVTVPTIGYLGWSRFEIPGLPDSTPKAGTDSGAGADAATAKVSIVTQTGAGTEVSSEHAAYALTDTGAGAETSRLTVPKSGSDTGTGVDASSEHASYSLTQSGAGADVSTEHASYAVAQPSTGADVSSEHAAYSLTQSGAGTEVSAEKVVLGRTETGAGADTSSLQAGNERHGNDSAAGTDSSLLVARLTRTDAGTGADASSVSQGVVSKSGSDAGTGADSSTLRASLSRSDTGACNDLAALHATLSRADAGVSTQAAALAFRAVDTGTSSDVSLARAALLVSQPGSALDVAAIRFIISQRLDAGAGDDHALVFKGGLPPDRMGASVAANRVTSAVGLNRGGEGSTIEGDKEEAEVTRWP